MKKLNKKDYLSSLPFFANLNADEKEYLLSYSSIKKYSKNEILYSKDFGCLGIIQLIDGILNCRMSSDTGKSLTLYRLTKGDVDVLSASCVLNEIDFETEIKAITDVNVFLIPAAAIMKIKEQNIYLQNYIYKMLSERFSDAMWSMQQVLFKRVDERIAAFLWNVYVENDDPNINITHEGIASNINSAREVVARMMKRFEEEGMLEYSRGKIRILDEERLKELAYS